MTNQDLKSIQKELSWDIIPTFVKRLSGGDINDVFLIEYNQDSFVVKKNDKERFPKMLEKEFRALQSLGEKTPVRYPIVKRAFSANGYQYLLMEYITPGENTEKAQKTLGHQLALQHNVTNEYFGWEEDNYIGSLQQKNNYTEKWSDFYAEYRLLHQTRMAFDQGFLQKSILARMESFCSRLTEIFPDESPALLHGDLWGGNYFIDTSETPVLYDPATYFGHREIDIAMTRLFGGFDEAFYIGYNEEYALENGWEDRVQFGQLYPNLVHLNLFGPAYLSSVTSALEGF